MIQWNTNSERGSEIGSFYTEIGNCTSIITLLRHRGEFKLKLLLHEKKC